MPVHSTKQKPVMLLTPNTADRGQVAIPPGGRAEFLIKAISTPGIYRIVQLEQRQQFLQSDQKVIAEIEVKGAPKPMNLPTKLPVQRRYYPRIQPQEIKRVRNFVFSGVFPPSQNPYVGIDFLINNNIYDELAVPHVVERGSAEEWHVQVLGAHHGGTEGHPFHVHVNHFEVISVNGQPVDYAPVADTVWVPLKSTVVIRMRFKEYTGKSVFHCHILPHEDTGMMENFLIL
jgi:FtsP/CotA-like multicopper oxidase with cupredoxin domain